MHRILWGGGGDKRGPGLNESQDVLIPNSSTVTLA